MALKNSQYEELMRMYERRRFRNLHDRDMRRDQIYNEIPAISEIDNQMAETSASQAEKVIAGNFAALTELKKHLGELRQEKALLLEKAGYPKDYLEMHYTCPDCQDTGYVDGTKCRCFKQAAVDLLYTQSGIKERLEEENFDTLSYDYYSPTELHPKNGKSVREHMTQVAARCKAYAEHFSKDKGSLLFTGSTGSGKTFMSNCIAKSLLDQGFSVIYLTAAELFDIFSKQTFSRNELPEFDIDQYILECDLLIIDDLGTEFPNAFTITKLFYCINERLSRKKGTVISTNLSYRDLADLYSERIASRVISYYQMIDFCGQDIRIQKKLNHRAASNGQL